MKYLSAFHLHFPIITTYKSQQYNTILAIHQRTFFLKRQEDITETHFFRNHSFRNYFSSHSKSQNSYKTTQLPSPRPLPHDHSPRPLPTTNHSTNLTSTTPHTHTPTPTIISTTHLNIVDLPPISTCV